MKLFVIVILGLFLLLIETNAQQFGIVSSSSNINGTGPPIDTTDFFPLQIGNYWEYAAATLFGTEYFSTTVIGDTLMPNGKTYMVLEEKYLGVPGSEYIWYIRKDANMIYRYNGNNTQCGYGEYKYFDFSSKDSTIWSMCTGDTVNNSVGNARGIQRTYYDYTFYGFLQKDLETKEYNGVFVNSKDTIWGPGDGDYPTRIAKAFGMVWQLRFNDGQYFLQGAIINGVKFGTITHVKDEKIIIPAGFKIEAYPNPFNSTVTLKFILPNAGFTEISVHNILGQKIKTILEEYKPSGNYNITYNDDNLSSGVYLVILKQDQRLSKEKIILLK
ncbi:MAG: T9SS type A sorting domain-containing protein [Ignavibacteriaceae bacterium]|jgi:hypothetical protein